MKSLIALYSHLLEDSSRWCSASTTFDLKTIERRFKHEGISFLTITLPTFAQGFERSLDKGKVEPSDFPSFKKVRSLPAFLQGLTSLVFDSKTGLLLESPNISAIYFVRQITMLCKKIKLPCSEERERAAYAGYIKCENEVKASSRSLSASQLGSFKLASDALWGHTLNRLNHLVFAYDHVPHHGPGSTADKIRGNRKYEIGTWSRRLEENFFPSAEFIVPNYGYIENISRVNFDEPSDEMPVRVITVPKTLKAPRIIAIEPLHMQYAQQSLLVPLVASLESDPLVKDMIGFTDQSPNQELARIGSQTGTLATMDLSEASDRVSLRLVSNMLRRHKHFARAVYACRSKRAQIYDKVYYLSKFASMGSALCFPMEAMVFLTLIFVAISKKLNKPVTRELITKFSGQVRVYGDDIIVPVEYADIVTETLETYGMKVNLHKSFSLGKFRESCGSDWYGGISVKPVYLRQPLASNYRMANEFISTVSFRNQLYKAGCWATVEWLDQQIKGLAPFPVVLDTSSLVGRTTFLPYDYSKGKWCNDLHVFKQKGVTIKVKLKRDPLDGCGALMKFFLKKGSEPIFSKDHLEYYGRADDVATTVRWA